MAKKQQPREEADFDVQLQYAPRIIAEHLGRQKYATSTKAIGELVANAFDAKARTVRIDLEENDLGAPVSLAVTSSRAPATARGR
jgi:hypothetical protein